MKALKLTYNKSNGHYRLTVPSDIVQQLNSEIFICHVEDGKIIYEPLGQMVKDI